MRKSINTIEQTAFRSFWNDGLLDIMLGLALIVLGVSWWQGIAVMGAVFPAVCVSMWHPLRKRLVEPRMGYVEFSGKRNLQVRGFRFGLMGFFAGTMMLGLVAFFAFNGGLGDILAKWIAGFPLLLIAIPALFFAFFTRCLRFAVYAALLILAGALLVIEGWEPHTGMMAAGIIIFVTGLVILIRFISSHPAEPAETA